MKELRCLGRPLDGRFADDGEAPTVFLENTAGDNNLELVTDHRLPPVAVHYRKIRINSDDGKSVACWVADGMTFDDAIARYKTLNH